MEHKAKSGAARVCDHRLLNPKDGCYEDHLIHVQARARVLEAGLCTVWTAVLEDNIEACDDLLMGLYLVASDLCEAIDMTFTSMACDPGETTDQTKGETQ